MLREVQKVSQGTDLYIVNTHFHPEHTTGEVAFPPSAQVIRAAAQQQDVDEMGMQWVERFRQRSPEIADLLKEVTFRTPAEIFEKEKVLDLGGVRVRIIRLGPGHTRGDTVAFVEGDRVLFSGDLAMKDLFPAFATPQSDSRTWLASLDQMAALQATQLVPAHYEVTDAPPSTGIAATSRAAGARRRAQAAGHLRRRQPRSCSWTSSSSSTPPGSSRVASRPPSRRCTRSCPEAQDAPNRAWTWIRTRGGPKGGPGLGQKRCPAPTAPAQSSPKHPGPYGGWRGLTSRHPFTQHS